MKYIIRVLVPSVVLLTSFSITSAQVSDVDTSSSPSCAIISQNLRYLSRDGNGSNDVSILQDFLNTHGYLKLQPTGFFGTATRRAVVAFQNDNGLKATPPGYVGAGTRAKIQAIDCNDVSVVDKTSQPENSSTYSTTKDLWRTFENKENGIAISFPKDFQVADGVEDFIYKSTDGYVSKNSEYFGYCDKKLSDQSSVAIFGSCAKGHHYSFGINVGNQIVDKNLINSWGREVVSSKEIIVNGRKAWLLQMCAASGCSVSIYIANGSSTVGVNFYEGLMDSSMDSSRPMLISELGEKILNSLTIGVSSSGTSSLPTVQASFNPAVISSTGSTVFSYVSQNTSYCEMTHPDGESPWTNAPTSFTQTIPGSIFTKRTTTVTCYNSKGQSASQTVSFTVK